MKITLELVERLMGECMVMWAEIIPEKCIKESDVFKFKAVLDNKATKRAGQCRCYKKEIGISPNCPKFTTIKELKNTIAHELLHAIFKGEGHTGKWKTYANKFNRTEHVNEIGEIKRYYELDEESKEEQIKKSKYVITCPDCGYVEGMKRKTYNMNVSKGTTRYRHKGCSSYMSLKVNY